jgi:hypothetical protein
MKTHWNLATALTVVIISIASMTVADAQAPAAPAAWHFGRTPQLLGWTAAGIIVVAVIVLFMTSRNPGASFIFRMRPPFFFWLGITYTLLLIVVAIVYNISYSGTQPYLIGGTLPIAVPWFGALGAVTISLEGVFTWSESRWNPDYNYWHCGRPVFGGVLGAISFFLFVLIVMSAGTTPTFLDPAAHGTIAAKDFIIYYVVAFLAGYREETFRELIRRVTDLILKPGTQSTTPPTITFKAGGVAQSQISFAATAVGSPGKTTVDIANTGEVSLSSPALTIKEADAASKDVFKVTRDAGTGQTELRPKESREIEIEFAPPAPGNYAAVLSVAATNLATPATIRVIGTARAPAAPP